MKPIRTPDMHDTMRGPEGSAILPLPVLIEDGMTASVWELDDEDRAKLAEGGHIGLVVMAHPTPPVALSVASPYCERCGEPMTWSERLSTFVCSEHEETCPGCGGPIDADEKVAVVRVVGMPPETARFYHWRCRPGQNEDGRAGSG